MNKVLILLLALVSVSCSSLHKFNNQKHFKQRIINTNKEVDSREIYYYTGTENSEHCFESNPNNKEIITVESDKIAYAINHFYGRQVAVSTRIVQINGGTRYVEHTVKDNLNFKLETSDCFFETNGGLFKTTSTQYTSFRLINN